MLSSAYAWAAPSRAWPDASPSVIGYGSFIPYPERRVNLFTRTVAGVARP